MSANVSASTVGRGGGEAAIPAAAAAADPAAADAAAALAAAPVDASQLVSKKKTQRHNTTKRGPRLKFVVDKAIILKPNSKQIVKAGYDKPIPRYVRPRTMRQRSPIWGGRCRLSRRPSCLHRCLCRRAVVSAAPGGVGPIAMRARSARRRRATALDELRVERFRRYWSAVKAQRAVLHYLFTVSKVDGLPPIARHYVRETAFIHPGPNAR